MNTAIEDQFYEAMLNVYFQIGKETKYWAKRYRQKVVRQGGLAAAKSWLLPTKTTSQGMEHLTAYNRVDLSYEALVLQEPWCTLFTAAELQEAQKRINHAKRQEKL